MELYIYMFTYINMRFFCVFCSAERVVSDMAVPPVSPHPCLTTSLWFAWGLLLGSLIRCVCLTPRSLVSCLEVASVPQAAGSSGLHVQDFEVYRAPPQSCLWQQRKKFHWKILCISVWKDVSLHMQISRRARPVVATCNHAPFDLCTFL